MKVLITGATGFLGTPLAAALRGDGVQVRALVRATSQTEGLTRLGVECVVGSLDPPENLDVAVAGMDVVVHAAGGGRGRSPEQTCADNRDTTRNLLAAARRVAKRFVLGSSLAAHGPSDDGQARGSSAPRAPTSHCGRSKAQAEELVLAARDELGWRPRTRLEDGFIETARWYREVGWMA